MFSGIVATSQQNQFAGMVLVDDDVNNKIKTYVKTTNGSASVAKADPLQRVGKLYLVGGGGGAGGDGTGGQSNTGGGGAGGLLENQDVGLYSGITANFTIGVGGTKGTTSTNGANGSETTVEFSKWGTVDTTVYDVGGGGGGGASSDQLCVNNGKVGSNAPTGFMSRGSGGGGGGTGTGAKAGGTGFTNGGAGGASGALCIYGGGGGGGGRTSVGGNGTGTGGSGGDGGAGGSGILYDWLSDWKGYEICRGGAGKNTAKVKGDAFAYAGAANSGNGGDDGAGGSGVGIFRIPYRY